MKPSYFVHYPEISISEARRCLPELLRRIDADPAVGYHIMRRNHLVAVLRSAADRPGRMASGWALLPPGAGQEKK